MSASDTDFLGRPVIAVTGLGIVSSLGKGVEANWEALTAGQSGVRRITLFDPSDLECQIAAEVKDWDPTKWMEPKSARRAARFAQFAVAAAQQAVDDSGLAITDANRDDIAIVRVEQLYPFHAELCKEILARYPKSAELLFAQEEPRNAGGALFILDRLRETLGLEGKYIGRSASPTPAVGSKRVHKQEQHELIDDIIGPVPTEAPETTQGKVAQATK